jgi:hypothetical protein
LLVTGLIGALVLVLIGSTVGTSLYFESRVAPGTKLAGQKFTGQTESEVRANVSDLFASYSATLILDGKELVVSAADLGITLLPEQTVQNAMVAGRDLSWLGRLNPFTTKTVPLAMAIDRATLEDYLFEKLLGWNRRAQNATVVYDSDQGEFVVTPSVDGLTIDIEAVVLALRNGEGVTTPLTITPVFEAALLPTTVADQAAAQANYKLAQSYALTRGDSSYTIKPATVASWVVVNPQPDQGHFTVTVDREAIASDIPRLIAGSLTKPATPRRVLVGPDGTELHLYQSGTAGTTLGKPAEVTEAIAKAVTDARALSLAVEVVPQDAPTEPVAMDAEYLVPGGEKWVEVNQSTYQTILWEGTTKVASYLSVIGRAHTPTPTGIFHVWMQIALQDMEGDDYLTKDVPWISYFNFDIAIHGNYWATPGYRASHGCVGLVPSEAKTAWYWMEVGTMVIVHW